jgi:hypothetical protein
MGYRTYLLFLLLLLFCVSAGFAGTESEKGDTWICPSGEAALYSLSGVTYGGGFAIGYGKGISIGMKVTWFPSSYYISVLELNFLFRIYFSGEKAFSGSFIQLIGGPALFFGGDDDTSLPSKMGVFTVGLSYGRRFLIKEKLFIEPSIRAGYPYIASAGLALGVRF